jgi:hypothetical protein
MINIYNISKKTVYWQKIQSPGESIDEGFKNFGIDQLLFVFSKCLC